MRLLKGRRKYQMNSNIEIVGLILSLLNYCFVFLMIFNLLKVNYFNPIVSTFVKIYKPISKILPTLINPVINIFVIAVGLKLLSLIVYFGSQYETITLLGCRNHSDTHGNCKNNFLCRNWWCYLKLGFARKV
jgi:type III secretory pathway component EscU